MGTVNKKKDRRHWRHRMVGAMSPHMDSFEKLVHLSIILSLPIAVIIVWSHYTYGTHTWLIDVMASIISAMVALVMWRKRHERAKGMGTFDALLEPIFPAIVVYPPTFMVAMEHEGIIRYLVVMGTIIFIFGTLAAPLEKFKRH